METAKISVIVPVFNVEKYLERCIKSILDQTYREFELILVDDGSTDSCGEICDKYALKDTRIKVIHKTNGGLSDARNAGLDVAGGDYISFIDSDDLVPDYMLKELYNVLVEYEVDLVKGNFLFFTDKIEPGGHYDGNVTLFDTEQAIHNYLYESYAPNKKINIVVWNALYKKQIFENIRFPVGLLYEDGYVTPKVLLKCKRIAHLNKVVYYYRRNSDGIMKQGITDKALLSLNDWKDTHYLIKKVYPQFNEITCRLWLQKYLRTYIQIEESQKVDQDHKYRHYIRKELILYSPYFLKNGTPFYDEFKLITFAVSPYITSKLVTCIADIIIKDKVLRK